ncbi:MAG: L-seryl-tRNA(Sec) selenium transferase [Dermatophilus congolensis]|nr:L-seryl-tRNA(Sec) selenium transferase [Dermatophilus congolensis]
MGDDPRRRIPRTDALLADAEIATIAARVGAERAKNVIREAQQRARDGHFAPEDVRKAVMTGLVRVDTQDGSFTPVINATGVVVHTNIGRAPLSPAAVEALVTASGYVDVELDLATGERGRRGAAVLDALLAEVPEAESALVVNNGAAALVLATTALAVGREVVVSRGEMVEIGDGFRLPELIASTGVRLREVGTTNRTHLADYRDAVGDSTGCILKVHPSNFRVEGFTSEVGVEALTHLGVPVVCDIGSGLLRHDPALPDEPDAATMLARGASVVTASGDKLLGGPQAGIVLGRADIVERMRRHPLARALRVDKLTLAALEATLTGPKPPVTVSRHLTADDLLPRTQALAEHLGAEVVPRSRHLAADELPPRTEAFAERLGVEVVPSTGRVGGGGAPGVDLPGWAVSLPEEVAPRLRTGTPAVLARTERGRTLVDLRCVPSESDDSLAKAILKALTAGEVPPPRPPAHAGSGDVAGEHVPEDPSRTGEVSA